MRPTSTWKHPARSSTAFLVASIVHLFAIPPRTLAYRDRFGPRDRFWRHQATSRTLVYDDVDRYADLETCLRDSLAREPSPAEAPRGPREVSRRLVDSATDAVFLVEVKNALSPAHVREVRALAACIRSLMPRLTERRAIYKEFLLEEDPEGKLGGNTPTYLAPVLSLLLPRVVEEMQAVLEAAYGAAGWVAMTIYDEIVDSPPHEAHPNPKDVGMRTSEHLTYNDFPTLGAHNDGATSYTVNFAFSGPDEYEGGEFYISDSQEITYSMKPDKYSCLIFLGGTYMHGVDNIGPGLREMFSTEYWAYPDLPFGSTLWNADPFLMEQHIETCDKMGQITTCEEPFPTKSTAEEEDDTQNDADIDQQPHNNNETLILTLPEDFGDTNWVSIRWLEEQTFHAYAVRLPPELTKGLLKYIQQEGIMEIVHDMLYKDTTPRTDKFATKTATWLALRSAGNATDAFWLQPGTGDALSSLRKVLEKSRLELLLTTAAEVLGRTELQVQNVDITVLSHYSKDVDPHADLPRVLVSGVRGSHFRVVVPVKIPRTGGYLRFGGEAPESEEEEEGEEDLFAEELFEELAEDVWDGERGEIEKNPQEDWNDLPQEALLALQRDTGFLVGRDTPVGIAPCDHRESRDLHVTVGIYLAEVPQTEWTRWS